MQAMHSIRALHSMQTIAWWPTVAVLIVATITDLRSRRIPNWLTFPFLIAGPVLSAWLGGWHGFGQSMAGLGLGALIYGIFYIVGGMGMGDVKLCAAIGAWIGPSQLLLALVITGVTGGLMAVIWAAFGGFLGELFTGSGAASGTGFVQSADAQDALCAGYRHWDVDFVFFALIVEPAGGAGVSH
jgi:prepilin peptidase CpaA